MRTGRIGGPAWTGFLRRVVPALVALAAGTGAWAQRGPRPNLVGNIERPLRYRPEGADFVIENGAEFFNRPLYGGNTAARFDAGDRPEFTFYLPGRGGNLRLGLRTPAGVKWLHDAARIVARYRPGTMRYEIHDPLLGGDGVVNLTAIAMTATNGLVLRVEAARTPVGLELIWAYGGMNGQRGGRDGDLAGGASLTRQFQLRPEYCADDRYAIEGSTFTLRNPLATLVGLGPTGARFAVADATKWDSLAGLLASAGGQPTQPVVVGRADLTSGSPRFLAIQRISEVPIKEIELPAYLEVTADRPGLDRQPGEVRLLPAYAVADLPRVFAEAETHERALRERVTVDTPDPYINAALPALNIAADAVWDEPQGALMHGAVAWRTKLLGWRGPYVMDELGWHDRARRHFTYWAGRQNTNPIPDRLPPPDEAANLARSEAGLHSNGDISNSHYDMNLVYIDAVFRHLLWTGDLTFARQMWPVIVRHLAWERRLFRREYGPEKLPLYEAYAAIWASDDLQYGGGGTAHASAYNYYHNLMAARVAALLGYDPVPYEREAELIARAMRELLWIPGGGWFAEYKDYLGLQLVHPAAAVWSFYHTIDSELPDAREAWQMTRQVDTQIPHLPVRGPGVPTDDHYEVVATSNWMPYSWSINNVVMAEIVHTALGYWQAGRPAEAFRLTKGALLASMYMGLCPGDIGTMDYLDVYRREAQRDFADGGGMLSRALIEGLFGVKPDALAGELTIAPGFPGQWDHAALRHPNLVFAFRREGLVDTFLIEPKFGAPQKLRLQVAAQRDRVARITLNGRPASWHGIEDSVGAPRIEVTGKTAARYEIVIAWAGRPLGAPPVAAGATFSRARQGQMSWWQPGPTAAPPRPATGPATDWHARLPATRELDTVSLATWFNDRVTQIFRNEYRSPRSPFVSLALPKQGIGGWAGSFRAQPEIDDAGLRTAAAAHDGRLWLPNGVLFATPGPGGAKNIIFTSQWDNYPREVTVPLSGRAQHVYLLMAGSTNWMQSRLDNGEVVVKYRDGGSERLALSNPVNWWPIDQDYFIDDYAFARPESIPPRVDLRTGEVRILELDAFKGKGRSVPGGAATVLDLPLRPEEELQSLTVRTLANDVVVGLMAVTLAR
jgi:hypothetical protein